MRWVLPVGTRDDRSGEYILKSGLQEGDLLIRQATSTLKDGQRVEMAKTKGANSTADASK